MTYAWRVFVENLRGLIVAIGAVVCYVGLGGVSRPLANIVAGVLLMAVGAYPYLRPKGKL